MPAGATVLLAADHPPTVEDGREWWGCRLEPAAGPATAAAAGKPPPTGLVPADILAPLAAAGGAPAARGLGAGAGAGGWRVWGVSLRMKQLHSVKPLGGLLKAAEVEAAGGGKASRSQCRCCRSAAPHFSGRPS